MSIKQISVFVENRPGKLYEITDILRSANIDIRALTIADTTDFGILRLIVKDPEKATEVLKGKSINASITNVIGVRLPDVPGGLCELLKEFNQNQVSIEYCYAFIGHTDKAANVIIRADNQEKAMQVIESMGKLGYLFLEPEDII